uniref:Predicted protein n=1 Tax=Hordeum vulgare subsp. vulgare TaxID=112509 RepID=F2CR12_HORVV|nr:predicted protein [Hordeum vulgare subsp. vulgare]
MLQDTSSQIQQRQWVGFSASNAMSSITSGVNYFQAIQRFLFGRIVFFLSHVHAYVNLHVLCALRRKRCSCYA